LKVSRIVTNPNLIPWIRKTIKTSNIIAAIPTVPEAIDFHIRINKNLRMAIERNETQEKTVG
jgi:hypothetical protein